MKKVFENKTTAIYIGEDDVQIAYSSNGKGITMRYKIHSLIEKLGDLLNNDIKPCEPTNHDIMQACIDQIEENDFEVGYIDPQFVEKFKPTINELSEAVKNELGKLKDE